MLTKFSTMDFDQENFDSVNAAQVVHYASENFQVSRKCFKMVETSVRMGAPWNKIELTTLISDP